MQLSTILRDHRVMYRAGKTMTHTYRIHQLQKLKDMLNRNEKRIYQAIKKDLGKSDYEILMTELGVLYSELDHVIRNLKDWMRTERVKTPTTHKGAKSYIYKQPYGTVLIISPWNYPLNLSITPLIGAIVGGNTAFLKPSEFTPNTSELLADMIADTFEEKYITVVQGGKEVSQELLELEFDYIFFTGSQKVGQIVMEKASKHLIPVTLELGGKSPVIIDEDAKISLAAKRIAWGKLLNAGQTCIAPDYALVHESVKVDFIQALKKELSSFYGNQPMEHPNYTKLIHEDHLNRLEKLLDNENIIFGGEVDRENRKMNPTLIDEPSWDRPIMQEEIFGPILPIRSFSHLEQIVDEIEHSRNPLALYYFSENEQKQQWVANNISFGGGTINDTIMHIGTPHLPFGGIGASGIGAYHGYESFRTFTHRKSVLKQTTAFDLSFRYPNSKFGEQIMKKLFKK
ncbi:aldehyde dehydrogenase [Allobacillus sp. GCM10007491]|uniref:Aldehyde dehydrogenase n=1 Tax=Allobacillus saliphilus TaxID=2912308 RepID=A0A941CTB7_9BACI|nr:aldehyde dehydrogenase [Allobacillus saliphilus]MBR7553324.1 aldehyde dehydrogenase [Allobacillus saliphilus]